MPRSGSARSHSSDSASRKSDKDNAKGSKTTNVKKLKEQHKKTRSDLETLEKKHEQVLNMNIELRQKFSSIEIQFKNAMKELMLYKNHVLPSDTQNSCVTLNNTQEMDNNVTNTQNSIVCMETDNLLMEQIQRRHNLKRPRPNIDGTID